MMLIPTLSKKNVSKKLAPACFVRGRGRLERPKTPPGSILSDDFEIAPTAYMKKRRKTRHLQHGGRDRSRGFPRGEENGKNCFFYWPVFAVNGGEF